MQSAGIYLHIPFCSKKCGYCDFNAYSGYKDGTKRRYVEALCAEIAAAAEPIRIPTIFFGGGTPTHLAAADLVRLLRTVRESFPVDPDAEISVEANPSDVDAGYLETLRTGGFNRISFGVQTFNDSLLKTIDRLHTGADAEQAVALARRAGFDNLSLDLMFALPRQTLSDWDRTLDATFALDVPHLSVYALILEEGTPFFARRERGRLRLPSEKVETAMFARAIERITARGYEHYEISNYARPGYACRHNRVYWRNEPYFGFGAGAVAYRNGVRSTNVRRPSRYIEVVLAGGDLIEEQESVAPEVTVGETVMLGLRLREGIDLTEFARRFGSAPDELFPDVVRKHTESGLLEIADGHLRLTARGLFLANEVMADFLP
ncbi:MAG: radical SAM family heme chaperone HemW [Capsulimonadales bacterium]|nr:radical SAM family heme chaperone HemW [Capsulimonadales bacterium]